MSIYDRLATRTAPASLEPASTSYFSEPTEGLDPFLFSGDHLRPNIRQSILSLVLSFLGQRWQDPASWSTTWIAGSGASHQWSAAREPGDLDVLIGVDWPSFRRANRDEIGLSDTELAGLMNTNFRECLAQFQHDWEGYDMTMYVNPGGTNIQDLHPYAAYNLTADRWDVAPDPHPTPPQDVAWTARAQADQTRASDIVTRYHRALESFTLANNPGARLNAQGDLRVASQQAVDLFDSIHEGRHAAFAATGQGYGDWANYRWQAGKASGAVQALKQIKDDVVAATDEEQASLYGSAIPSARDTLVAAAVGRRYRG